MKSWGLLAVVHPSSFIVQPSLDSCEALLPDVVELHRGGDVAQAVFGDLALAPLGEELGDIHAGDTLGLGGLDAEGLAVEIEVELAGGALAAADTVEGQLLRQVAVGLGGVAVAQPVAAKSAIGC